MASNFVKTFFDSLDKFLDILNVGRLIFYTAAGFLAIYPIYMILKLLTLSYEEAGNFFKSFAAVSQSLTSDNPFILLFASIIAGFLIANVGYTVVIEPLADRIKNKFINFTPSKDGFSSNYRLLRNNHTNKEDYTAWLISEFFRYVEIGVYVPMGFIIGLIFLVGYTVVYPFYMGIEQLPMTDIRNVVGFLLFLSTLIALLLFYVWPTFWRPLVVERTLRTYLAAKISLIRELRDFEERNAQESK